MKSVANILSIVLYPMFIPTYAMGILCWAISHYGAPLPMPYIIAVLVGTLCLTAIAPLIILFLMMYKGHLTDIYMDDKQERTVPYLTYVFMLLVWCYYLHRVLIMPTIIWTTALCITTILLLVTLINRYWKISAHLTGIGSLLGAMIGYCWHVGIYPMTTIFVVIGITALLMWARLYLNAHTPLQVIAGFGLGLIGAFAPALWG